MKIYPINNGFYHNYRSTVKVIPINKEFYQVYRSTTGEKEQKLDHHYYYYSINVHCQNHQCKLYLNKFSLVDNVCESRLMSYDW